MRLLLVLLAGTLHLGAAPTLNKAGLAEYIHYAEAYTDSVTVSIGEPVPSLFSGWWKLPVHITAGSENLGDKVYYVNQDGTQLVSGALWNVPGSPFSETLSLLPRNLPAYGPADAPLQIVIFSDFECPYCKQFARTIRDDLMKAQPDRVHVSFADFPLESKHPWSRAAAEAAHCISDGNAAAFWKFHDWIFEHQNDVSAEGKNLKEMVVAYSTGQGLDASKIGACMDSHATAVEVAASEQVARLLGVRQTPTFFINGRKIEGALPWTSLKNLVDFELKRPKIAVATGQ